MRRGFDRFREVAARASETAQQLHCSSRTGKMQYLHPYSPPAWVSSVKNVPAHTVKVNTQHQIRT